MQTFKIPPTLHFTKIRLIASTLLLLVSFFIAGSLHHGTVHAATDPTATYTLQDASTIIATGTSYGICPNHTGTFKASGNVFEVSCSVNVGGISLGWDAKIGGFKAVGNNYTATLFVTQQGGNSLTIPNVGDITINNPKNISLDTTGTSISAAQEDLSCESGGSSLASFLCPMIQDAANFVDNAFNSMVVPLLKTQPITFDTKQPVYAIWNGFRVLGNLILVVAIFVIVFMQATRGGTVDAYTIKKIMPRLLVAAILINVSIYLVSLALDITNVVGMGLRAMILEPLAAAHLGGVQLGNGSSGIFISIGVTAIVTSVFAFYALAKAHALLAVMQFLFLFILVPAAIAVISVLVTLILRQGIIVFLVIVSPIAFALYCLPNTEQYFKKWWDLLFKTLMVYPIVMVIFSVSNVMSAIFSHTGG